MASTNTKTSLDTMFKYKVASDVNQLVPSTAIVQRLIPKLSEATRTGRNFLWPVALTLENGVTYGDQTAFAYEDDVAAVYDEITLDSNPCVLKSRVALGAANRMANEELTFITHMSLRSGNMKESIMKRAEISCLYGKSGLATISSQSGSGTTRTVVFTDATWAPGIWGGLEGSKVECRNGATLINTNADMSLTSVDYDNKSIVVSGNATDLDGLTSGRKIFFKGSYANDFNGIDIQLTNTGSLFGVDAAAYALWKPNALAVSGAFTMTKALKGVAKAVGKGGLAETAVLLVSSLTWEGLNADLSALRAFDGSYSKSKGENGVMAIEYHCQSGTVKIIAHPMVKEGEAFLFPEKGIKRIGATEITFGFGDGDYFEKLEGNAGFQLIVQYDWCILVEKPARCVKYTGITNS
jgi:hypothetical protein